MAETWMIATGANLVLLVAYSWLALIMFRGMQDGKQWKKNPLGTASFFIFFTCAIGHGTHALHTLEPNLGITDATGAAARVAMSSPALYVVDTLTAIVAIGYLTIRSRLTIIHTGASLCEDMEERQNQAKEMNEQVLAKMQAAKQHMADGDRAGAAAALDEALHASKTIITHLLGDEDRANALGPGDLRQADPA